MKFGIHKLLDDCFIPALVALDIEIGYGLTGTNTPQLPTSNGKIRSCVGTHFFVILGPQE